MFHRCNSGCDSETGSQGMQRKRPGNAMGLRARFGTNRKQEQDHIAELMTLMSDLTTLCNLSTQVSPQQTTSNNPWCLAPMSTANSHIGPKRMFRSTTVSVTTCSAAFLGNMSSCRPHKLSTGRHSLSGRSDFWNRLTTFSTEAE